MTGGSDVIFRALDSRAKTLRFPRTTKPLWRRKWDVEVQLKQLREKEALDQLRALGHGACGHATGLDITGIRAREA